MSASSPDNEREENVSSASEPAAISRETKHVPESPVVWSEAGPACSELGDGLSGGLHGPGVDGMFLVRKSNSALKSISQGSWGKRAPGVPFRIYSLCVLGPDGSS